jgi:hypothetical protein
MTIVVNPGTGSCEDATEELATIAMKQFVVDAKLDSFKRGDPRHDTADGRFSFVAFRTDKRGRHQKITVDMPGWPLDRVRYLGPPQNIWDFPRLYVNGGSWVWCYGVSSASRYGDDGDDEDDVSYAERSGTQDHSMNDVSRWLPYPDDSGYWWLHLNGETELVVVDSGVQTFSRVDDPYTEPEHKDVHELPGDARWKPLRWPDPPERQDKTNKGDPT